MSFFDVMKRMAQGKPAFEDEGRQADEGASRQPTEQAPSGPAIRKGDDSSFPVVYVRRTKTNLNGDKMEVYCQIVNAWPEEVLLDKITIGGEKREIDDFLGGGEEQEFLVYSGSRFAREVFEAQLDYKTQQEGDYFRAVHDVKCRYHDDDKRYSVSELRLRRPILDIYG